MLEMDVCVTKDGVLVVHHDDNLSRTCGSQEHVKDFNYEDLPPFKEEI
jgi:glycerophosphoryl diester phosphodiesterase